MNPLVLVAGLAGLGYLVYKSAETKADGSKTETPSSKDGGLDTTPPGAELKLPRGVALGKTAAGGDLAYVTSGYQENVLLSLIKGAVELSADKPNGPTPVVANTVDLLNAFTFAADRSQKGMYVMMPASAAATIADGKMLAGDEAQIVATSDPISASMYTASGWASIAAPGDLDWAKGMNPAQVEDYLRKKTPYTPTSDWKVSMPSGAGLPVDQITSRWDAFLAANQAGSKDDFSVSFAIEKANADGSVSRTLVGAIVTAMPVVVGDFGQRTWQVTVYPQPSYPRPPSGTKFVVADSQIVRAESIPEVQPIPDGL